LTPALGPRPSFSLRSHALRGPPNPWPNFHDEPEPRNHSRCMESQWWRV